MGTVFLQLTENQYRIAHQGLCLALNETEAQKHKEQDQGLVQLLDQESRALREVLGAIGEQGYSQLANESEASS